MFRNSLNLYLIEVADSEKMELYPTQELALSVILRW
jgi:hypothetical protein